MSLRSFLGGTLYPHSVVQDGDRTYCMTRLNESGERRFAVQGDADGFSEMAAAGDGLHHAPLSSANLAALRVRLPWLTPTPLGMQTSFGFGDRIGLATPGHIQALRAADPTGRIAPILAQQSVRENSRTGRTPQGVMDDACWAVFQEGWRAPWGADADHIKTADDLPPFVVAGYTFYTIDPSDHVDNDAQTDSLDLLREKADRLPWETLGSSPQEMRARYLAAPIQIGGLILHFDESTLLRALAKYGRALAHTIVLAGELSHLMRGRPFDLELSVDETDTPTSAEEHYFIAAELARCGVPVVSLAPRFVGKFQKGVDYIGNAAEFEREFAQHAAIMRHFGGYKMSIHTGSDKFSLYPIIGQHTSGRVHVKTAGTSYLEALRVMAQHAPARFRQALALAHERFEKERKSYYLDCQPEKVPQGEQLSDADLPGLLEQFDARQLLHVTYGSILDAFGEELRHLLRQHEAAYDEALVRHFRRHISPFTQES